MLRQLERAAAAARDGAARSVLSGLKVRWEAIWPLCLPATEDRSLDIHPPQVRCGMIRGRWCFNSYHRAPTRIQKWSNSQHNCTTRHLLEPHRRGPIQEYLNDGALRRRGLRRCVYACLSN